MRKALGANEQRFRYWKSLWNKDGKRWPILNTEHSQPITHEIRGYTCYDKDQVDNEMVPNLNKLPTRIPDNHPAIYSRERASALTGLACSDLNSKEARKKHNLLIEPFWVRFQYVWRDGRTVWVLMPVNGFTRDSVDTFVVKQTACKLPDGTMSANEMARQLRKASKASTIHSRNVREWCKSGLLDAKKSDYVLTFRTPEIGFAD